MDDRRQKGTGKKKELIDKNIDAMGKSLEGTGRLIE